MQTKNILRLAYLVVAVALVMWAVIGGAIWSAWRTHRAAIDATAAANAPAGVSALPQADDPLPEDLFDRSKSSVQYEQLAADADASQAPDWLNREIGPLPPTTQSMLGWAAALRKQDVQVCCWQYHQTSAVTESGFMPTLDQGTVRELLDELCRCDPRYRWEWIKDSEIVNIVPVANSASVPLTRFVPLAGSEAPLGDVSFRPKRLYYCMADVQGHVYIDPYGIRGEPTGYGDILYWPFQIKAKQITVRDYLNLLAAQYDGMTWSVNDRNYVEFDAPVETRRMVVKEHRDELE